jgi:hypothetical protein
VDKFGAPTVFKYIFKNENPLKLQIQRFLRSVSGAGNGRHQAAPNPAGPGGFYDIF